MSAGSGMIPTMATPSHDQGTTAASQRSSRDRARLVAVAILVTAAAVFAFVNFEQVKVDLIFGSVKMPLFVVIVACLLIGAAIGAFLTRRSAKARA